MRSETEAMSEAASGGLEEEPRAEPLGVEGWLSPRWEVGAYLLLLLTALAMRLWDLGSRAMHHDESQHALYSWYLAQGNGYAHNPLLHGPFQFHGNALLFSFFGDSDFTARLLYVLFGTALVGLPWLLRGWLGRTGALLTAVLLAFSPTLLYFSRFARNDILMAVWALGLVLCIWHYLRDGQSRYLYLLAAILALAFATKETTYLTVALLGLFLLALSGAWRAWKGFQLPAGRPGVLLVLLFTLSLPQGAAALVVIQGPLGITLGNTDFLAGPVGMPLGDGATAMAVGFTIFLLVVSTALGLWWDWRRWLFSAAIFYSIWLLLFTTVFTNASGIGTGMWQSLGYWGVQQGEARGGQPWFYYLAIGWTYEFLPFLVALLGAAWYVRRGDTFSRFLVFWTAGSFLLFSLAGEKMPWLLVHVTLPAILLAGRTLGDMAERVPWRMVVRTGALGGVALIPLLLFFVYRLAFFEPGGGGLRVFFTLWGWFLLVAGLLVFALYLLSRAGWREGATLAGLGMAAVLLLLSFRVGRMATYENGDVPKEMLVYTQTSPDIPEIMREIQHLGESTGQGQALSIAIDGADGFGWPWHWYLRHYQSVAVRSYEGLDSDNLPSAEIVMVADQNQSRLQEGLEQELVQVRRFRHRWWFPEEYRDVTVGKLVGALVDREAWRTVRDYWLFRELETPLGSADAYLYYSRALP